jgi:hypothetical protein
VCQIFFLLQAAFAKGSPPLPSSPSKRLHFDRSSPQTLPRFPDT